MITQSIRDFIATQKEKHDWSQRRFRLFKPDGTMLWESNLGPQTTALNSTANEILFGGARGGSKSEALAIWLIKGDPTLPISDPLSFSYVHHLRYRALVVRQTAEDMREFVSRCDELWSPFGCKIKDEPPYAQFPSGARIYFRHLQDERAALRHKGPSYVRIGVEELTEIPNKDTYLALLGSLRSPYPRMKEQLFATTNPDGAGTGWVRERFVEVIGVDGKLIPWGTTMRDPVTKLTRVFIPSRLEDNPHLKDNAAYRGMLLSQPEHRRRAWLQGDWNALSGQFFPELRPVHRDGEEDWAFHVVDDVQLQPYWFRWGSGDWGYKHWAAFYKFVNNPEDGRVIVYDELARNGLGSFELGIELARWWERDLVALPDAKITIHISPDCFRKTDESHTIAEQMQQGMNAVLGPGSCFIWALTEEERGAEDQEQAHAMRMQRFLDSMAQPGINLVPANTRDRVGRAGYIRDLMRWKKLLIPKDPDIEYARWLYQNKGAIAMQRYMDSFKNRPKDDVLPKIRFTKKCGRLIKCLQSLVHDTRPGKNPEDVMKMDGDDFYDALSHGTQAHRDMQNSKPKAFVLAEKMREAEQRYTDPTILAQISRYQNARYDQQHVTPGGGITFPRAGSGRWRQ